MSRLSEKQVLVVDAASIVARAARRIGHPARWTKRYWALDGRGRVVRVDDPSAVRFCLVGALLRAEHELHGSEIIYSDSRRDGPAVDPSFGPTRLAFGLLAHLARAQLEERGMRFSHATTGESEPIEGCEAPPVVHPFDLPVLFNGFTGVGQADCLAMLIVAGHQLFLLNDTPELLDLAIADEALEGASPQPAPEQPEAGSAGTPE